MGENLGDHRGVVEMAAMSVKGPPQCGQDAMSISNTRLSNWAQLRRASVEGCAAS